MTLKIVLLFSFFSMASFAKLIAQDEWKLHLAWQIALEENNFSTGLLDGIWGGKSQKALEECAKSKNVALVNLRNNQEFKLLLNVKSEENVLISYTVTQDDINRIVIIPKDWNEKAKLPEMGYETLEEVIQGKFKCSLKGLRKFNPSISDINLLQVGAILMVPNFGEYKPLRIHSLSIDLLNRELSGFDENQNKVLFIYCSVAQSKTKFPGKDAVVVNKALGPNYTFNPKYWPEINNVDRVLIIKPGPKNPVGLAWTGLDLPGYGIHGTPIPDNIGKTGSHGCFRLTNWHAIHLAKNVPIGAVVKMIGKEDSVPFEQTEEDQGLPVQDGKNSINTDDRVPVFGGDQRR